MPIQPTASLPPGEGEGVGPDPRRAGAYRFWRSFALAKEEECREALLSLAEIRGEEYAGLALEGSSSPESGKFLMVEIPATSPKNAREAWSSDRVTSLVRVNPNDHCLALDGDEKKYDGGDYFVACGSLNPSSVGPDACNIGTHKADGRRRVVLPGPAYMVKVRASSAATKPKVLAGAQLLEVSIPTVILDLGITLMLEELKATPGVWRVVLENYPGLDTMQRFFDGRDASSPINVETVDEASSHYSTPRVEPEAVPSQVDVQSFGSGANPGGLVVEGFRGRFVGRTHDSWGEELLPSSPPSWRNRGEAMSHPGTAALQDWQSHLRKSEAELRGEMNARFGALDRALDQSFANGDRHTMKNAADARAAMAKAQEAFEKAHEVEGLVGMHLSTIGSQPSANSSDPKVGWEDMSPLEQERMVSQVLSHLDIEKLSSLISTKLGLVAVKEELRHDEVRLGKIEREFASEHGTITKIQEQMATWDARRNTTSSERGGYVFTGPQDVQALVTMAGAGKLCTLCLDVHGMLTLAQDPYVTYEAGVQVHANAIKASYGSVVESRLKLSFEIPYPELIVKCVESANTAGRGGAKWGPMFATADLFEDDFRDGSHRRVVKGIENAFELTQKAIDHTYPLSTVGLERGRDDRKLHTILSDQNRRAYRQCIGFIESLLPFYRTLKGGSLSSEEAWDRVFVFVMEFLTSLREVRVISSDMSEEASMIWVCFKATDLAEEFRSQKFVEHPKALSILALTSIEREGKTMALLEQRISKQITEAGKSDKLTKLDTRVQTMENKIKNIVAKNPELK